MSRRNPPAKWVLPTTIDPIKRLCVTIPVPDEIFHKAAFWGALLDLASAYKWQDDPLHKAREVALVWRSIIDNLAFEPCNPEPTPCDCFNVEDFMSSLCDLIRWNNGVLQVNCCGKWENVPGVGGQIPGSSEQPPPSDPPAAGDCQTFLVTLNGSSRWLCPFPVSEGNTILIEDASGGWSDGTINWFCPNGGFYTLGLCGSPSAPVGTDPLPSVAHMRLVGAYGSTPTYFDASAGLFTIPSGESGDQLILQANDDSLSDNTGSISFKVTICNTEQATWCYEWDLTEERGPFAPLNDSGQSFGLWFAGTGWTNPFWSGGAQLTMLPTFDTTGGTHIEFDAQIGTPIVSPQHLDILDDDGTTSLATITPLTAGAMTIAWSGSPTSGQIWLNGFNFEADPGIITMTRVKMSGIGSGPLGPDTC